MQASNRIIVNTLAQYGRTIVNILLTLYSSRLILEILGVSDYGIYTLIAGVVSMLSFFTNSLVATTQRFLSVAQGKHDNAVEVRAIFNNSMIVHLVFGVLLLIALGAITPLLFNGFLNIPADRENVARVLYYLVIAMLFLTFVTAPYRASLISHENIVYISIVDVLDAVFKLGSVIVLMYLDCEKLVAYGVILLGVQFFNLLALGVYGHMKYDECVFPRIKYWRREYGKKLMGFAGWTMYSTFCIAVRNQGVAVILNRAMNTAINAAYGIGLQISGYMAFLNSSLETAVAPQLMKAVGAGDHSRALYLAEFISKSAYLLLAIVAIPVMFQINFILGLWLVDVPPYTGLFAIMTVASMQVDLLSIGLAIMVRATGNIRKFSIWCYTPKFLIMPAAWLLLKYGKPLWTLALCYFLIETAMMVLRIFLLKNDLKFSPSKFSSHVILRVLVPTVLSSLVCWCACNYVPEGWPRFISVMLSGSCVLAISAYYLSLNEREKNKVHSIVTSLKIRFAR
jgi:O-antigen/teichoic acid export membrane protein